MSSRAYLPWFPGDFKADCADLSLVEQAVYRNLIDHLWSHGGTVESDTNRLLAASGLAADWTISGPKKKQILSKILSYFEQKQGQISHAKVTRLADRAREISKLRAEAGKKGGQSKPKQKLQSKPNHKDIKKKRGARKTRLTPDFEFPEAWKTYCKSNRPDLNPQSVFENFLDYHLSKGTLMLDWQRAFQRWVRHERTGGSGYDPKPNGGLPDVPREDSQLNAWAKRYGGPAPKHQTGYDFHAYRQDLIAWRRDQLEAA